jgi:IS30 family transposase
MRTRLPISTREAEILWVQWKLGATISHIGRMIGRKPGTVHGYLSRFGGIAPRVRIQGRRTLSMAEREEISRGLAAGLSARAIARAIGRAPSTVTREIARNGGRRKYRSTPADGAATVRRRRPQPLRLESAVVLRELVEDKLSLDWSPEQIAGWLRRSRPDSPGEWVSHESIYRALYLARRSGLQVEAIHKLRSRRKMRRSRRATTSGQTRGQIVGARPLCERPAEVESRLVPGHWEGDLISGKANTHVVTVVERSTRFTVMLALTGKDTITVVAALSGWLRTLPTGAKRSLTWDRGMELARHAELTTSTSVPVFFCDPQSPWQRGTNENTNRLIRQYLPKGTSLSHDQSRLDEIAAKLNSRPRKVLGFQCPKDAFSEVLR